jgi:preprotein translocase subunit SecB
MRKSLLELIHYFITDLSISTNKAYDPEKEVKLELSDLNCVNEVHSVKNKKSTWQISLRVQQETAAEKNSPYDFGIQLIGLFELDSNFPQDKAERFVTTNGTAMLYGAAREALRAGMAKGPYVPLLLPSVTFLPVERDQRISTKSKSGK